MEQYEILMTISRMWRLMGEAEQINTSDIEEVYTEWVAHTKIISDYVQNPKLRTFTEIESRDIASKLAYLMTMMNHPEANAKSIQQCLDKISDFAEMTEETIFFASYFTDTYVRPMAELMHKACTAVTEYEHGIIDYHGKDIITDAERRDAHE